MKSFFSNSISQANYLAGSASATFASFVRFTYRSYTKFVSKGEGPVVYINSIPKAGTHLITTELARLGIASNSWLHINTKWVNKETKKRAPLSGFSIDLERVEQLARTVPKGTFFSSHLPYSQELDEYIGNSDFRSIFLVRDPRDILVSSYFYMMRLKRHPAHSFLQSLPDEISRYRALLYGHSSYKTMEPIADSYEAFLGWVMSENVLMVKFEDLVGGPGGGSDYKRCKTLKKIIQHTNPKSEYMPEDQVLLETHRKSSTFRSGKTGTWREYIPADLAEEVENAFESAVLKLGYPK